MIATATNTQKHEAIDTQKYGALLLETLPVVIGDEAELDRLTESANKLVSKGIRQNGLSAEEDQMLRLLTNLIQDYETANYPIPDAAPNGILKHFLEVREIKQARLIPIFGSSGNVSEILSGKRGITAAHAKALASFFGVSAELFI